MKVLFGIGKAERFAILERVDDAQNEREAYEAGFRQRQRGFPVTGCISWQQASGDKADPCAVVSLRPTRTWLEVMTVGGWVNKVRWSTAVRGFHTTRRSSGLAGIE